MRSWLVVVALGALVLFLLSGCAEPHPQAGWKFSEWSTVRAEGAAFHESKRRPWGERLEP